MRIERFYREDSYSLFAQYRCISITIARFSVVFEWRLS